MSSRCQSALHLEGAANTGFVLPRRKSADFTALAATNAFDRAHTCRVLIVLGAPFLHRFPSRSEYKTSPSGSQCRGRRPLGGVPVNGSRSGVQKQRFQMTMAATSGNKNYTEPRVIHFPKLGSCCCYSRRHHQDGHCAASLCYYYYLLTSRKRFTKHRAVVDGESLIEPSLCTMLCA